MASKINGAGRRALEAVREFTVAQRTLALIGAGVLVLGSVGLSFWLSQPSYSPLFSGLSGPDASAVVKKLEADGVKYELTDGGGTIMVPAADVNRERIAAAALGLPSSESGGYSLLDKMGVAASNFQQDVTYKRAIEGELATTIQSIAGVEQASVKIATPEKTVFSDQVQAPTASVFVKTAVPLTKEQVKAIVHLTSSATPGMAPEGVSVVDSEGRVLSGGANDSGSAASDYESATQAKVQGMLDELVGAGNSTVVVAATANAASGTTTTESYTTPEGNPTISQQTSTEKYGNGAGGAGGVAGGVLGEEVQANTGTGTAARTGTDGGYQSTNDSKVNALNKVTATTTSPTGSITRQTVSVAIDSKAAVGIDPTVIENLVTTAAGIDTRRGDRITVESAVFSRPTAEEATAALDAAGEAQGQKSMMDLITTAVTVLGGLIALVIVLVFLKKLFRKPDPIDGGDFIATPADGGGVAWIDDAAANGAAGTPVPLGAAGQPPVLTQSSAPTAVLEPAGFAGAPGAAAPTAGAPAGYASSADAVRAFEPAETAEMLRALMDNRSRS